MLNKFKNCIKEWWFNKEIIFRFYINICTNGIFVEFSILEYGLTFGFEIPNFIPFTFYSIWDRNCRVSVNKFFEEQLMFNSDFSTKIDIYWNMHQDHSGFHTFISLLGLEYSYEFIDRRHWNYELNSYKTYNLSSKK